MPRRPPDRCAEAPAGRRLPGGHAGAGAPAPPAFPGARRRAAATLAGLLAAVAAPAAPAAPPPAADPDAYDPLLDRPAAAPQGERYEAARPGGPGFFIGGGAFLYAGRVRSVLEKRSSGLRNGAYPGVLLTLGGRTALPLEVGFDLGYGLGGRWDPRLGEWAWAHDLLLEPRLLWHWHEDATWDFVAGAAGSFWLFDVEMDGIAETLLGPFAVVGVRRHLDPRSLLFAEVSGGYGKDTLAFRTVDPTPEERLADPTVRAHRDIGAWYPLVRLSAGYRLSGF